MPGITLTPATDTNELGFDLDHTVTALVSAGDYGPVEGVRVEFEITAGPNAGETGVGATDVAGEAEFTYTPAVVPASLGTDTITACFTDAGDTVVYGCDTAEKTWQDPRLRRHSVYPRSTRAARMSRAPRQGRPGTEQESLLPGPGP